MATPSTKTPDSAATAAAMKAVVAIDWRRRAKLRGLEPAEAARLVSVAGSRGEEAGMNSFAAAQRL